MKTTLIKNVNGFDWEIVTSKNTKGFLYCYAQAGRHMQGKGAYSMFQTAVFRDPCITLFTSAAQRATEKAVNETHAYGLQKFQALRDAQELPANPRRYNLPLYTILAVFGYNGTPYSKAIVTSEACDTGMQEVLHLESMSFSEHEEFLPVSRRNGNGYYVPDVEEQMPEAEALDLIRKAREAEQEERERYEQEREERKRAHDEAEAKTQAQYMAVKPSWAKAAIIAEFMHNDSDPMTDYFSSHAEAEKTALLAWSRHERNDFNEMRAAAKNYPEIPQNLAENRQNWSGGHGYFLGCRYSGWKISKVSLSFSFGVSDVKRAISNGLNFAPTDATEDAGTESRGGDTPARMVINSAKNGVEIHFTSKPAGEVIENLKRNGWRWAKFNKCWYKADSDSARRFAEAITGTTAPAATGSDTFDLDDMLEAQAEQWSRNN